jgi:glycosyltransferase involved in cell wall biosynthesis
MNQKLKVLLVSSYDAQFVRNDESILKNHFITEAAIFSNPKKSLSYILYSFVQIFSAVRKTDVSLIWFADFRAFLTIIFSQILRKKTLLIVGGYETANEPEMKYGSVYKKKIFFIKYALKHCTLIFAISDFSKKEIEKLVPKRIAKKIYLCVTESSETRSEKTDKSVVLIGNAVEEFYPVYKLKGIDTFVKAAALLPDYNFTVIGRYSEEIISKLNPSDNVEFTGLISNSEVQQRLSQTKVYCQLSFRESFGLALAESMQQGCVPVVTNRGAMPELVGNTGFYVPFGNAEETAKAIVEAMKSDKGQQAQKRIRENFSRSQREKLLTDKIKSLCS